MFDFPAAGARASRRLGAVVAAAGACLLFISPRVASAQARSLALPGDELPRETRLPAPTVTVAQLANGCVRLSWTAVPASARYLLGRSLGTNGYQRVADAPTDLVTEYLDGGVSAGTRVSYSVTAVDAQGLAGMRATSESLVSRVSPVGDCRAPASVPTPSVSAQRSEGRILVYAAASGDVARVEIRQSLDGRYLGVQTDNSAPFQAMFDATPGEHRFEAVSYDRMGNMSPRGTATITVASDGPRPVEETPATLSPATQAAELSFAVAGTVTIRSGATTKLEAPAGAEWSSLDPRVAGVGGDGVVRAHSRGEARIVAISPAGPAGVRVTVVRVLVSP